MSNLYKRSIDELNEQQKKFKIILPEPIIIKKYPAQKLTFDEPNVIQFRKSYIDDNVNDFMQLPQRKLIIKNDNTISEYTNYLDKLIGIDHISLSNHKKPDAYYQFNMENKTDADVRCDKLQTENDISNDFNVRERENEGEGNIESIKESNDDYTTNLKMVLSSYKNKTDLYDEHTTNVIRKIDERNFKNNKNNIKTKNKLPNYKIIPAFLTPTITPPIITPPIITPSIIPPPITPPIITPPITPSSPTTQFVMPQSRPKTLLKPNNKTPSLRLIQSQIDLIPPTSKKNEIDKFIEDYIKFEEKIDKEKDAIKKEEEKEEKSAIKKIKNDPNDGKIKSNGELETDSDVDKRLKLNLKIKLKNREARAKRLEEINKYNEKITNDLNNRLNKLDENARNEIKKIIDLRKSTKENKI